MVKYGKYTIWTDDEQWIMCSKPRFTKNGEPSPGKVTYFYSSLESLFRALYQHCTRDNSADCQTLREIVAIANVTAQELEQVIRDTLEFRPTKGVHYENADQTTSGFSRVQASV